MAPHPGSAGADGASGLSPSLVLVLAFLAGLIKPTDIGMRSALVSAAVPADHPTAAMGISRTTQDSARIGGALAGAGFMTTLGMASAYLAIAALYVVGALPTLRSGSQLALPVAAGPHARCFSSTSKRWVGWWPALPAASCRDR